MNIGDYVEAVVAVTVQRPSPDRPAEFWDKVPPGTVGRVVAIDSVSVRVNFDGLLTIEEASHWRGIRDFRMLSALEVLARVAP